MRRDKATATNIQHECAKSVDADVDCCSLLLMLGESRMTEDQVRQSLLHQGLYVVDMSFEDPPPAAQPDAAGLRVA